MDRLTSRFFRTDDLRCSEVVLPLHPAWWSRPYEYGWAGSFAEGGTVLDAACGIEHPFKFFLVDRAAEVHACDREAGILSRDAIRKGLRETYGEAAAAQLPERYLQGIHFRQASITALPYREGLFDRIFCLSVLEHLEDRFNRHPWLPSVYPLRCLLKRDIRLSLGEFKRVLKDDGLIILTFDYPDIHLGYLADLAGSLGLCFAGETDFTLPVGALYAESLKLHCFRAVLKKRKD